MQIMQTTDNIYHVICNHPDYNSQYYSFAVQDGGEEITNERNAELRKMIEKEVNPCNFWHSVTIYAEYYIDGKMHKVYI